MVLSTTKNSKPEKKEMLKQKQEGNKFKSGRNLFLTASFMSLIATFSTATLSFPGQGGETINLLSAKVGEDGQPSAWQPLTFSSVKHHTEYHFLEKEGQLTIQAKSKRSASGMIHPLDLDPKKYQNISWCWSINRIISKGDVTKKEGDDYAARIYVTFKFDPQRSSFLEKAKFKAYKLLYGKYPPKAALNYIWANKLRKGKAVKNAYTERALMIAVQSGDERVGEWVCEERNLYDDYRKHFGEEPPNISGIAVMTDTDNTGETVTSAYSRLKLQS